MTTASFRAEFADWKLIKTRSTVQIVLEIPVNESNHAYEALGGMPVPGRSIWVAVARLAGEAPSSLALNGGPPPRKHFTSLVLPQQAVLLCKDPRFWKFLSEEFPPFKCTDEDNAAEVLRLGCGGIESRRSLRPDNAEGKEFIRLREKFLAWKLVT